MSDIKKRTRLEIEAILMELVRHILQRDKETIGEAIDSLAPVNHITYNVAERLLTGRRVEEYFLANTQQIIEIPSQSIIDLRDAACGYDFGVQAQPQWAIEVKGLKTNRGVIQFTCKMSFIAFTVALAA
ncbi:MAG: hypothetical protein R3E79_10720 [Caldilineaceae bacterium]